MTQLTLTYFDIHGGRAEPARLAMAIGGIAFEDKRFGFPEFAEVRKASYYSLLINGEMLTDAVWFYPDPKPEGDMVRGRVAFGNAITVA
jgi:hypothetical protein